MKVGLWLGGRLTLPAAVGCCLGIVVNSGGTMGGRVVVLRTDDGVGFVADACAALADTVNHVRVARTSEADGVEVYAELVVAYGRLVRRRLVDDPDAKARVNILDHLEHRVRQTQAGEIMIPLLDVVDRFHGEITLESAGV